MTGSKMQRKNVSSGTQWELALGYSRVVRLGDSVYVSGTTATDKEGHIVGVANPICTDYTGYQKYPNGITSSWC